MALKKLPIFGFVGVTDGDEGSGMIIVVMVYPKRTGASVLL